MERYDTEAQERGANGMNASRGGNPDPTNGPGATDQPLMNDKSALYFENTQALNLKIAKACLKINGGFASTSSAAANGQRLEATPGSNQFNEADL